MNRIACLSEQGGALPFFRGGLLVGLLLTGWLGASTALAATVIVGPPPASAAGEPGIAGDPATNGMAGNAGVDVSADAGFSVGIGDRSNTATALGGAGGAGGAGGDAVPTSGAAGSGGAGGRGGNARAIAYGQTPQSPANILDTSTATGGAGGEGGAGGSGNVRGDAGTGLSWSVFSPSSHTSHRSRPSATL